MDLTSNKPSLNQLYKQSESLFLNLTAYYSKALHEHGITNNNMTVDQKKILKLFSYTNWSDFMDWIEEKAKETQEASVEDQGLPEIIEEEADL